MRQALATVGSHLSGERLVLAGIHLAFAGALALAGPARPASPSAIDTPPVSPGAAVEGIIVIAARPKEQTLIDRKVYTVTGDLQSGTATAAEVLNKVPSVDVDSDGNLSLRGDTNVTILVDGKPSAQFSGAAKGAGLLQFPAQDIERIEVMTNPPARYRAEGSSGVINIITRKNRAVGFSGTANASLGDQRRFLAAASGTWNTRRLALSGGVTLRQDAKTRIAATDRTASDPVTGQSVLSHQVIDEHFVRLLPQVKLGADYAVSDRLSASAAVSHREQTGTRYFTQTDRSGPAGASPTSGATRYSDGHEWSVDNGQSLRFDGKLAHPGETLSLSIQRSVSRERERYAYLNDFGLPAAPSTRDHLRLSFDFETTGVSLDYALPLSGDRGLKLGVDVEVQRNRFDDWGDTVDPVTGLAVNNPAITDHFRYRQRIETAYGEYQTPLGRWSLQAGLRLEEADVRTFQITGNVRGGQRYFRVYPSLNLDHPLWPGAKVTLSASRRITRPDPQALNPFTDSQDTRNLRAGNPNLRPQDTWSYELGYSGAYRRLTVGLTGYYRFNRDSVTDVTRVVSAEVVLATKANLPVSRAAGLELSASGKIFPQLSYNSSGNLFFNQIDAAALGFGGLKSTTGLNAKASLDWRPTASDTAQLSFSRTDRRLTPQGYVSATNQVNLGYQRRLWSHLSAVATVSDLFDGQRMVRVLDTTGLRDVYSRHQLGRVVYAGLSWTFGSTKKSKVGSFDYDQ